MEAQSLTALDVDRTHLDVHGVQLELHLAGDDRVHPGRIAHRLVLVERHRRELVGQCRYFYNEKTSRRRCRDAEQMGFD